MEAPANETPSIKAPRSLVIIHTVFLEIGLVILVSLWGRFIGGFSVNPGVPLSIAYLALWVITWLFRKASICDTVFRVSAFAALLLLPLSGVLGFIILIVFMMFQSASLRSVPQESRRAISMQRYANSVSEYIDANIVLLCIACVTASIVYSMQYTGLWTGDDWVTAAGLVVFGVAALSMSATALSYRYRNFRQGWSDVAYATSMKYSLSSIVFIVAGLAVVLIHNTFART